MVNLIKKSSWRIPRKFIEQWMQATCAQLGRELKKSSYKKALGLETVVVFVTQAQIQGLNKTYRQKNKATDILSFDGDGEETLGELVLCGELVESQAKAHGLSTQQELGYLLIHGLLHLLGFEHENGGPQAKEMMALQDRVFEKLWPRFFKS